MAAARRLPSATARIALHRLYWLALLGLVVVGCAGTTAAAKQSEIRERIADLQNEQARHEAELISIQREIIEARAELAAARLEVEKHKCTAQRADLEAKVEVLFAGCVEKHANHRACLAENEADSTKKTATGCGAGALLSLLFPPAGIAAVAGGCAMGATAGTPAAEACGEAPPCPLERAPFLEQVLLKAHIDSLPQCGDTGTEAPAADPDATAPDPV